MAYLNNNTGILKEICNGRAVKLPQRCGRVLPSYEVAILWRRSVVVYRRFGTTYRSDIQGETSCLKTSVTGYQSIPLTHPRREKAPGWSTFWRVSRSAKTNPTYTLLYSRFRASWLCINKIQQDATVCRYLFTAKLLYMFRTSIAPIVRSTKNVTAAAFTGHSNGATTCTRGCSYSFCTPDDGRDGHPIHIE